MKRLLNVIATVAVGVAAAAFVVMSDARADHYTFTLGPDTDSYAQQGTAP